MAEVPCQSAQISRVETLFSVDRLGAVILAAGASTRMGTSKLLMPWGAGSVLGSLICRWKGLGVGQVGVVYAKGNLPILEELTRWGASAIENAAPSSGMFSSVQCAARWGGWAGGLTHWVIALGDQPHLGNGVLKRLLDFASEKPDAICQLTHRGRPRHPVVLPRSTFLALADCPRHTLKAFLEDRQAQRALWELEDEGLDLDMDYPEDYEKLRDYSKNSPE